MAKLKFEVDDNAEKAIKLFGGNLKAFQSKDEIVILVGPAGTGKAQPLGSRIPTPKGWTVIDALKVGDYVFSEEGQPTEVQGIFPQGIKDSYIVTFDDHSFIEACGDHIWMTKQKDNHTYELLTTKDIMLDLDKEYEIPLTSPVIYPDNPIGIESGSFYDMIYGKILISPLTERVKYLQSILDNLGYVRDSLIYIDRRDLESNILNFLIELVQSLGGVVKITNDIQVCLPIDIIPFTKKDKLEFIKYDDSLLNRKIVSVESNGQKEMLCISVASPTGLYLADNYIVTHNTFSMCLKMHLFCVKYPGVKVLLCRKSLPALRNSVVKTYQTILEKTGYTDRVRTLGETRPTNFIYDYDEKEWDGITYKGVSEITLSQIDGKGKALGAEYDMVYVNQPDTEGLTEEEFLTICSRARLTNAPYRQRIADPNPANEQHWLKLGEITPQNPALEDGKGGKWELIKSSHKDNPEWYDQEKQEWTEVGKDNIRQLEKLPENKRKNLLEGEWFTAEGMAFGNSWDRKKHLYSLRDERSLDLGLSDETSFGVFEDTVPQHWHHYLSIDWGGTDPFVALLIAHYQDEYTNEERFIIHKHIYITEADIFKVSEMTRKMCEGYEIKNVIADRGRAETTVMEKALDMVITNAKKGAGSVEDSINICTTELNSDRWMFLNYEESLFHEPDPLLLSKNKLMGPEEIPNLKLDINGKGIAKHQQDHYYDAWKYFCRYWSDLNNGYKQPTLLWI